jgi:hypothetical protein
MESIIEDMRKTILLHNNIKPIEKVVIAQPIITPQEHIKRAFLHSVFKPCLNNGNYIYEDAGAVVGAICKQSHAHKLLTHEIAENIAKCPTCTAGTVKSRKIVQIMRANFNIILLYKTAIDDAVIYISPKPKIELRVITNKPSSISNNIIYINYTTKANTILFLRKSLMSIGYISPEITRELPFSTDLMLQHTIITAGNLNNMKICEDSLMLFENC